jgi:hypothetical protein
MIGAKLVQLTRIGGGLLMPLSRQSKPKLHVKRQRLELDGLLKPPEDLQMAMIALPRSNASLRDCMKSIDRPRKENAKESQE